MQKQEKDLKLITKIKWSVIDMLSIDEAMAMLKFNNKHIADLENDDLQQLAEWLEELKEYKALDEQDRLIKLPCKYVWRIVDTKSPNYAFTVKSPITELRIYEIEDIDKENCKYFSTEEKAEAKLKELRGEEK